MQLVSKVDDPFLLHTLAVVASRHPFSILTDPDSHAMVCDSFMRFSDKGIDS